MGARLRNVPMEELAVSARNRGARARGFGGKDAGDDRSRAVIHRGIEPERRIDRVESMSIESAIERSRPVGVRALTTHVRNNYLLQSSNTVYQVLTAFSSTLRGDGGPPSFRLGLRLRLAPWLISKHDR